MYIYTFAIQIHFSFAVESFFFIFEGYKEDYVGTVLPCPLCVKIVENWNPLHIKENEPAYL